MDTILEINHKNNSPLTKEETKTELANIIRKRNPSYTLPCVSDTLYYQYFNHDKNIRLLKGSIRTDSRTNVNSEQVVQWPKDQQDFLINNKVPLERIWNLDETATPRYNDWAPKTSIGKVTIQTQGTIIFNQSDNHSPNLQEDVADILNEFNIHCYKFPANSTHLLQPLDLLVFGIFKRKLNQTINNLKRGKSKKGLLKTSKLSFEELSDVIETSWDATASPITIKNAFEMVKIDWNLIKTSYWNELENNDNKSLTCTSNTLVLNVKPSSTTQIACARKIGFQINNEEPKKRGRPPKVTINSTFNVLNVNIQNNFNIPVTESTSTFAPQFKLNKNGQPRKKYCKKLKTNNNNTIIQQNSNKISEID
ncbi:hypothetical protein ACTFIY_010608 [Dictyostelium cf. discoideum]